MKTPIIIFSIFITCVLNAQSLKIKNLKIADYEIQKNGNVEISTYTIVDKKGNLIVYSDSWDGKNFFQYKLTQEEVEKLNLLAEKDLEAFVAQKKLNKNQAFAGKRKFITFNYKGKKKSLCFIEPFMNNEFMNILKPLSEKIYKHESSAKITSLSTDFGRTEKEIIEREKIDNYLPEKAIIRVH
ncbi:hypothetical protein [Chryseobacterium sp. MYb328]|uniref:hypothetical protein n=1 Tax=Chryseobacterium sp. MYb328 TaxID=2745231 RepID=UPI0030B690F4